MLVNVLHELLRVAIERLAWGWHDNCAVAVGSGCGHLPAEGMAARRCAGTSYRRPSDQATGSSIASATVKISHKGLPPPPDHQT